MCETMNKNCFYSLLSFLREMKENSSVNNKNASLIKQFISPPLFPVKSVAFGWELHKYMFVKSFRRAAENHFHFCFFDCP